MESGKYYFKVSLTEKTVRYSHFRSHAIFISGLIVSVLNQIFKSFFSWRSFKQNFNLF